VKIVVLGKNGMLGSCFVEHLSGIENLELQAFGHADLDVCDPERLSEELRASEADFVINCSAYTDVDGAEEDREGAFAVNAEAVGAMATICAEIGATLIHFSTDYVFSGKEGDGYSEGDEVGPALNVYGESKLAGEKAVAASGCDYFIVRTAWLYGPNGKNFVDTMLKLGAERDKLSVVGDQIGSPTYSKDLCEAVIDNFIIAGADSGIYHLTNAGSCSWYEFAAEIFRVSGIDVELEKVGSDAFPRPAKRPGCSVLKNTKLGALRGWQEALGGYLSK
jgi:dTDP-4-dehydrorhamnose reductase